MDIERLFHLNWWSYLLYVLKQNVQWELPFPYNIIRDSIRISARFPIENWQIFLWDPVEIPKTLVKILSLYNSWKDIVLSTCKIPIETRNVKYSYSTLRNKM